MSFSRSLSGTVAAALAALAAMPAAQQAEDESCDAAPGVIAGHQHALATVSDALKPALEALPESVSVSGSVHGHANDDQSGDWGFSLSIAASGTLEAAAPAETTNEPAAATT